MLILLYIDPLENPKNLELVKDDPVAIRVIGKTVGVVTAPSVIVILFPPAS